MSNRVESGQLAISVRVVEEVSVEWVSNEFPDYENEEDFLDDGPRHRKSGADIKYWSFVHE